MPLIAVDNDAPNSKRLCYIGTSNYEAGRAVGTLVKEALPDGGTVALFVGLTGSLNAHQRCQGVLDELAGVKGARRYGRPAGVADQFSSVRQIQIAEDLYGSA